VDDVWADCLHYYGKDVWEMDGASALKLAFRLPDIVRSDVNMDPPKHLSSVFAHFADLREAAAEDAEPASLADLKAVDPAGDVEFVEVAV